MEYYFNNLNPTSFQRLINAILQSKYGEAIRLTPLRGADGGKDGETAPGNPFWEFQLNKPLDPENIPHIEKGRYLFQVKHHRTVDTRISDARASVLSDFETELKENVLSLKGIDQVNYFFLITNVPSSKDALSKLDFKRKELLSKNKTLHADIWWQEHIIAFLDQLPSLWQSFPEMFAGGKPPLIAEIVTQTDKGLSRAVRIALERQYNRDRLVKFKQIELEKSLTKLFVDLDIDTKFLTPNHLFAVNYENYKNTKQLMNAWSGTTEGLYYQYKRNYSKSALQILMDDRSFASRILLEGGPGQGKSTITQMLAQIYRNELLKNEDLAPEGRWKSLGKIRLPLRIELRVFAEWLSDDLERSVEEYISTLFTRDSGGNKVEVSDIHSMVENSPVLLIFDGLDEVGSELLRDIVLSKIADCVDRFKNSLHSDLKVIVTTRPPAIAGRREQLPEFRRFPLAPMSEEKIKEYLDRWLSVQILDEDDRENVRNSFERRRKETHVKALAQNPMQLSVLLHFIRLKGEAFPDRRAELYREYFRTVIDRDVEKSPDLRQQRDLIEILHQLLGYKIHSLSEAEQADGMLSRTQLLQIVQDWLNCQNIKSKTAGELFELGEERLGLIVALKGEGEETRYGYEIQPIREYFAAAFINEQIQGNAHDVYESMLPRPYWKEVAIFLAGLRRPNEKADLIARAKQVDKEPEHGWRQNGRSITLQLLQEGVLSQPRHVYFEALEFLIDLLDPTVIKSVNEPKDFLRALPNLIKQGDLTHHSERILQILNQQLNNPELYTLYRLYKVLSEILPKEQVREEILKDKFNSNYINELVRIVWSYRFGIDMHEASGERTFWTELSENTVARYWWFSAIDNRNATNLQAAPSYHAKLAEQYAINSFSIFINGFNDLIEVIEPQSNWAIWYFVQYQQLMSRLFVQSLERTEGINVCDYRNADYRGLKEPVKSLLKKLNEKLYILINDLLNDPAKSEESLCDYIDSTKHYLKSSGLSCWIACRAAVYIIESWQISTSPSKGIADKLTVLNLESERILKKLGELWEEINKFYVNSEMLIFRTEDYSILTSTPDFGIRTNSAKLLPSRIRLEKNKELVNTNTLLVKRICHNTQLPFDWLNEAHWTSSIFRPLVEGCRNCLPELLQFINGIPFTSLTINKNDEPLLIQDMRRILKIVRLSEDESILTGAIVILSTSKFINVAGSKLILKMLKACLKPSIGRIVFNQGFKEGVSQQTNSVLLEVASEIVKSSDFPDSVSFAAAAFLYEHSAVSLPSLVSLEKELCINIQQMKPTQL